MAHGGAGEAWCRPSDARTRRPDLAHMARHLRGIPEVCVGSAQADQPERRALTVSDDVVTDG